MTRPVLILAAHGAGDDSSANRIVHEQADRLRALDRFESVIVTFNKGTPRFSTVLDTLPCSATLRAWRENAMPLSGSSDAPPPLHVEASPIIIVPLMTAAGYFSKTYLPAELEKNDCYADLDLHITEPVGTHPELQTITAQRIVDILNEHALTDAPLTILAVGHGTRRSPASKESNEALANHLRQTVATANVVTAYLDDDPHISAVVADIPPTHNIVTIPFLIGGGSHALDDIPTALNLSDAPTAGHPVIERHGDRLIICDIPTGRLPQLTDIILDLAAVPVP